MTWIAGTAGGTAVAETRPLRCHLASWPDVAFYGLDSFMDAWNPAEKARHNVSTFH